MSKFASKQFWSDTFDRAVTSLAQGLLASSVLVQTGVLDIDWVQVFSLGGSYALVSVLTSIALRGGDKVVEVSDDGDDDEIEVELDEEPAGKHAE